MYDATSEPNEFVADTREEAITKASRFYAVDAADMIVNVPAAGRVYGLGGRVVVVAVPKSAQGQRGGRSEEPRRERGNRGRERGRSRQSGKTDRPEAADRGSSRKPDVQRSESRTSLSEPSTGTALGKLSEVGEYVLGLVERMGLGPFELSEGEEGEYVVLELKGAAAESLTANEGRAVGALQLLANQAALRADESAKRVVVDCGGEDADRGSFLERQAVRAARRAIDTGRSVALDPMNGRDRRALHMAIREVDGVVTMSVGSGRYRQVVIVPEGAPEYEEAVQASREAEARSASRDSDD